MAETIIIPSSEIKGDLTSCKIERQVLRVDRRSAFSLQETSTYISYDVCNKQILSEYVVPELSGVGFILLFTLIGVVLLVLLRKALEI